MTNKPIVEPYDFVPLGADPQRRSPCGHDRYYGQEQNRYSGLLRCRLTAKTPLFVYDPRFVRDRSRNGHETVDFPVLNGVAIIPGTSLKGVIRSVVEAVEHCCFTLPTDWRDGVREYRGGGLTAGKSLLAKLPAPFLHCQQFGQPSHRPGALCPACRLFGSMHPRGQWAFAGKVFISDARSPRGEYVLTHPLTLDVLMNPKPEARPQVYLRDGYVRGRKFYRHRYPPDVLQRAVDVRPPGPQYGPRSAPRPRQDRLNKTVRAVQEGAQFGFEVEYTDLDRDELCCLLYALTLEQGMWHKIGMGKAIGLGSAHIEIAQWTPINRKERYRKLGAGMGALLEGEPLASELTTWLQPYRQRDDPQIRKLRETLVPHPEVDVRYPEPEEPGEAGYW